MSDMRQFSEESLRRIQRDHTRLKTLADTLAVQQQQQQREGEIIRTATGFTTTNSTYPTYPTATGHNTYVVKLRDYSFTPATGVQSRNAQGDATRTIIARTWDGSSVTQNTPVVCDLIYAIGKGPQWWIRPAVAATAAPLRWTQMVSSTVHGTWWFWQHGAASRDTDATVEITDDGVFAFPRFGIGTYYNSVGTAFSLTTTPTAYNDKCITFSQKAWYSLCVTVTWGLPSLTSSQFNTDYRTGTHTHTYTDDGANMTTGAAQVDAPAKDSRQATTIVTEVNGVKLGRSSIPGFYSTDTDSDRYATHSAHIQLDRSSSLTGIDIRIRRQSITTMGMQLATPYVVQCSVRLEQISDNF